jgi:two-component system phosphate regulon sensor histidine kinase PhoR
VAVITLALLTIAVRLFHRSARLAGLQEQFVANVSHDLRTPIAQIRMFSETLLRDRMPDPAERQRSLSIIQRQAEVLTDLVDNIVHASDRRPTLRPVRLSVDDFMQEIVDSFGPLTAARDATLTWHSTGSPETDVDPVALRRIVMNLIDNALKYAGHGSTIIVSAESAPREFRLIVEDDGPGIPRESRDRAFGRFQRVGGDLSAETGAGIGLSVVRDLAHRHGGSAEIEASAAQGARVVVVLREPR